MIKKGSFVISSAILVCCDIFGFVNVKRCKCIYDLARRHALSGKLCGEDHQIGIPQQIILNEIAHIILVLFTASSDIIEKTNQFLRAQAREVSNILCFKSVTLEKIRSSCYKNIASRFYQL